MRAQRDLMGRRVGDFIVRRKLGEGGQGVVWIADQQGLGREAVVKIVECEPGDTERVTRALAEAVTASKLDHPYAAHVYAVGQDPDGFVWIAMEYVNGTPLDAVIATAPLPLERFVPVFERLCEVTAAAHELGIVHRDIKPSNVMVLHRAGKILPKLLDFGIARLRESADRDAARGTPLYTPPERWRDPTSADPRGDVYALGVLAYEALTGRAPLQGSTVAEIARAHAKGPLPPLGDGFPAALDDVLGRALAKHPGERFASALDLAAAVRAASGLEPDVAALPQLPADVRRHALERAPQPIAEAIAALEAARNAHQAREAVVAIADSIARWLGILALACRSRIGGAATEVRAPIQHLRREALSRQEWIALAREICRPFASRREAFPLPELVAALFARERGPIDALVTHVDAIGSSAALSDAEVREQLAAALVPLEGALAELANLDAYAVVVPRGRFGELWNGVRRSERLSTIIRGRATMPGHAVLVDAEGAPVLALAPLVQIRPPSPGAVDEMFLIAGGGQHGARLDAPPRGYEHHDEDVWLWLAALLGEEGGGGTSERAIEEPYRGLRAFGSDDAALFFGREREAEALANRLIDHTLLAVVGPSGAGKSSFVHAGVVPRLPASWTTATLRPGSRPLEALHACVERARPALLVVDQFEELFTLCSDPVERERFARELVDMASRATEPVRVVITLRDDFLIRAEQLDALRSRIGPALQLLATPVAADLLRILVEPARRAGYEFEDAELAREMVAEVADQPSALAILSFTAAALWKVRDRQFKLLRRRSYEALGGVAGALTRHAEATYGDLAKDEQRLVREAFRHLVTADGTRAVLGGNELRMLLGGGDRAERVIDRLVAARLLVTSEAAGGNQIEIVHEALLVAWPRLARWRREDAEGARLRDQLRAAARQWDERGRPRGLLWRDDALAEYRLWRARYPGAITDIEDAFTRTSLAAEARGRRRTRVIVISIVGMLTVGLVGVGVLNARSRAAQRSAETARGEAQRNADDARRRLLRLFEEQGRRELLAGQPQQALALLAEAYAGGSPSPALRFMLARAADPLRRKPVTLEAGRPLFAMAVSHDGALLASGDERDRSWIWETATGKLRCTLDTESKVSRLDFSPDGTQLVTAGFDGKARVWDAASCALVRALADDGQMETARFSPDGTLIVTAANDTPKLWNAATGALVRALHAHHAPVQNAIFSPDGRRLATGGEDKDVIVWDVASGRALLTLHGHGARIAALAFSADGNHLVSGASGLRTGDEDFTVREWDLRANGAVTPLVGHRGHVVGVDVSTDGKRIASASYDGSATVWDAATGKRLFTVVHPAAVGAAVFSADGTRLLTAAHDGSVRISDATDGTLIASLVGHRATVRRGAFLADGKHIATISYDGTAKIWPFGTDYIASMAEARGTITGAALSDTRLFAIDRTGITTWNLADRTQLASVADDHAAAIAATANGRNVTVSPDRVTVRDERMRVLAEVPMTPSPATAAFAPDGNTLVVGDLEGGIHVLDASGRRVRTMHADAVAVWRIAFSRDGSQMFTAGHAGDVITWEVATGRTLRKLHAHDGPVFGIAACGNLLATASADRTAKLWNDGHLVATLEGHTDQVVGVSFDAQCRFAITYGPDSARVWSTDGKELFAYRHQHDITWWAGFTPDSARIATAAADGGIRLWNATLETRAPLEVGRELACLTPYRVRDERLVLDAIDPKCP